MSAVAKIAPAVQFGDTTTQPLTVATLEEGSVMARLETAFRQVMETAMDAGAKGTVTLSISIAPAKDDRDQFVFDTAIKKGLPSVKGQDVHARGRGNVAYTDLKSVNRVLRRLDTGGYEDVATGEPVFNVS